MDNRLHEIEEGLERELGALLGSVNFSGYSDRARLRADDLAVRTFASQSVLDARKRVLTLIERWSAENIAEPTREHPFPPEETSKKLRSMHGFEARLAEIEGSIRSAEMPDLDHVWNQRTDGVRMLETLLSIDRALVRATQTLAASAASVAAEELASLATAVSDLEGAIAQRRSLVRSINIAT